MTQSRFQRNPRPDPPKLLLFSAMTPSYLRDHAEQWGARGLNGCLFHIGDWSQDVWSVDGDPSTVGEADQYFQEVRAANEAGRKHGIDSNFITFAFYNLLPDWFDDVAWKAVCARYGQSALFAQASGCRGVAIDMEYVQVQYNVDWPPYVEKRYGAADLLRQARQRGDEVMEALLQGFPGAEVLVLPEVHCFYGPLSREFLSGMIEALARRDAPAGLHLLTEITYVDADWRSLAFYPDYVGDTLKRHLSPAGRSYWQRRCSVAMGCWPLSHDHEVRDETGQLVRWPNDKKPNLTVEEFRVQTAICKMVSRRYHWLYAHGAALWSLTEDEMKQYPRSGDAVPPTPDIADYYEVMSKGEVIADSEVEEITDRLRRDDRADLADRYGSITAWWLVGPLDWPQGTDFHQPLLPEERFEPARKYPGRGGDVQWRRLDVSHPLGLVGLVAEFGRQQNAAAYAVCRISSDREQPAVLRIGSDDDVIVWLNGKPVWEWLGVRGLVYDEDQVPVVLPAGESELMLKVGQHAGLWGFAVRVTDDQGRPLPGVRAVI